MDIIVGMGEYVVSNDINVKLKTFALSSCVAVTAYSKEKKAAGMIHIVLPYPQKDRDELERPAYYATTGIPLLISRMRLQYGCREKELIISLFGGATTKTGNDCFAIGKKNLTAIKEVLAAHSLRISRKEVGGEVSRSLSMDVATGTIDVITKPILI